MPDVGQSGATARKVHDGLARYYAVHFNGLIYATFESAHMALLWQRGNDREIAAGRDYFHLEDAQGRTVRMSQGRHAYAILDALDRAERAGRDGTQSPPSGSVGAEPEHTPRGRTVT